MALRFLTPDGEEWRTGMNNIPVFAVNSARVSRTITRLQPRSGDWKAWSGENEGIPGNSSGNRAGTGLNHETPSHVWLCKLYLQQSKCIPFRRRNRRVLPVSLVHGADETVCGWQRSPTAEEDKNYLFDNLIAQIAQQPQQWRLIVTVGRADDPTDDATLPWPEGRRQIDAGTVTIDQASSEDSGRCTAVNYDPLVLPSGIEPSNDPLLSARSAVYARSFTLRAEEEHEKPPSAVTTQEGQAGGKSWSPRHAFALCPGFCTGW
jgi:catalase